MAVRTITIGILVGLVVACALPLDGKTACRTSQDCIGERICDDGQCRDGACEAMCTAICGAADECIDDPPSECESRCNQGDAAASPLFPTLGAPRCRRLWDEWQGADSCDGATCILACAPLCEIARECGVVVDAAACVEGCVARNENCNAPAPTVCVSVPTDVLCYEDVDACPD